MSQQKAERLALGDKYSLQVLNDIMWLEDASERVSRLSRFNDESLQKLVVRSKNELMAYSASILELVNGKKPTAEEVEQKAESIRASYSKLDKKRYAAEAQGDNMGFILVAFQENVERIKAERGGKKAALQDDTRVEAGKVRKDVDTKAPAIKPTVTVTPVAAPVVAPAPKPAAAPVVAIKPAEVSAPQASPAATAPVKPGAGPQAAPAAVSTKEAPAEAPKPKPTIVERTAEIADKTATIIHQAKDRTDLIRTTYALGVIDGEFKGMTVEAVVEKYGKRIGGTHYSDEVLLKAANQPWKKLPEFESLLTNLVLQQKLTKKAGKFVIAREGGGVIVTIPDGDPTFAFHEARHAESAHYHFRKNPEALKKAEAIVQKQGREWKAKAIGFFLGTPYWDAMGAPNGFNVPTDINRGKNAEEIKTKKQAKAEEYLKLSGDTIVFPKDMQKKAWILDEFVSYASDMNEQTIPDVPEFADFFEKTAPGKK